MRSLSARTDRRMVVLGCLGLLLAALLFTACGVLYLRTRYEWTVKILPIRGGIAIVPGRHVFALPWGKGMLVILCEEK